MYCWEEHLSKIILKIRSIEIKYIRNSIYVHIFVRAVIMVLERLPLSFSVVIHALTQNMITAEFTFTLATYFNQLLITLAIYLPRGIILLGESLVTIKRLEVLAKIIN